MVNSSSEQCCTNLVPEAKDVYVPTGEYVSILNRKVGDADSSELPVYVAGSAAGKTKKALVCIYGKVSKYFPFLGIVVDLKDIFGLHPNTLRGADLLAKKLNIQIFVPDFFRGKGWDINNMPPREGRENMQKYIAKIGSLAIVKNDLMNLNSWLHDNGKDEIGVAFSN